MGQYGSWCVVVIVSLFLLSTISASSLDLEPLTLLNPYLPSASKLQQASLVSFSEEVDIHPNSTFYVEEVSDYYSIIQQNIDHSNGCFLRRRPQFEQSLNIEESCSYISLWINLEQLSFSGSPSFYESFVRFLQVQVRNSSSELVNFDLSVGLMTLSSSESPLVLMSNPKKAMVVDEKLQSQWLKVTIGIHQGRWAALWVEDEMLNSIPLPSVSETSSLSVSFSLSSVCDSDEIIEGSIKFKGLIVSIPQMPLSPDSLPQSLSLRDSLPVPVISSLDPSMGNPEGGTAVTVYGTGLVDTPDLKCLFGDFPVQGMFLSGVARVVCLSPRMPTDKTEIEVRVSNDGHNFSNALSFKYQLAPPIITGVTPTSSINAGGIAITVEGQNFLDAPTLTCFFGNLGWTNATYVKYYGYGDRLICPSVSTTWVGSVWLQVSNDLISKSNSLPFEYVPTKPAWMRALAPIAGYTTGGTVVTIYGEDFVIGDFFYCRFNDTLVKPIGWDSARIFCVAPPSNKTGQVSVSIANDNKTWSGALPFVYVSTSSSLTLKQPSPSASTVLGGTTLQITASWINVDEFIRYMSAQCLFDGSETTEAQIIYSPTEPSVKCRVPPIWTNQSVNATVSLVLDGMTINNSVNIVISPVATPQISSLWPTVFPVQGGIPITVVGTHILPEDNIRCNFEGQAHNVYAAPILINPDGLSIVQCNVPSPTSPGTIQMTIDDGFTTSQPQNITFTVPTPTIVSVTPTWGIIENAPSSIIVYGSSFLAGYGLSCLWNSTVVNGTLQANVTQNSKGQNVTDYFVVCPLPSKLIAGDYSLSVSNGGTPSNSIPFTFYQRSNYWVPKLTSVDPNHDWTLGGTPVVITGKNFINSTYLRCLWDLYPPVVAQYLSDTQVRCITPAVNYHRVYNLSVSNNASTYSAPIPFTYNAVPSPNITSYFPDKATVFGGGVVIINATDVLPNSEMNCYFAPSYIVNATLIAITNITINGSKNGTATNGTVTQLYTVSCPIPPNSAAQVIKLYFGSNKVNYSYPVTFEYRVPAPIARFASPDHGFITGGTKVLITGERFFNTPGLMCKFGTVLVNATVIANRNTSQITCLSPATTKPGLVNLYVTNDNKNFSYPLQFTYYVPPPKVVNINPRGDTVLGGTVITAFGTNFLSQFNLVCKFGVAEPVPAKIVETDPTTGYGTTITCTAPRYLYLPQANFRVSNDGLYFSEPPLKFRYSMITPAITSIKPTSDLVYGGTDITIVGSNFFPLGFLCKFNNTVVTAGIVVGTDFKKAVCPVPRLEDGEKITHTVQVQLSVWNNQTVPSNNVSFTYAPVPVPKISSISPHTGLVYGGILVVITGQDFVPNDDLSCRFVNGNDTHTVPAMTVEFSNNTKVTCTNPAADRKSVARVSVSNNGLNFSNSVDFTYLVPVPTLDSVDPSSASILGGTIVTATGTDFVSSTLSRCRFANKLTGSFQESNATWVDAETITCPVPKTDKTGAVLLSVTNDGESYSNTVSFTYLEIPTPTLTSITPSSISITGKVNITVIGNNFLDLPLLGCNFGSLGTVSAVLIPGGTQVVCQAPAASTAVIINVRVTNDGRSFSNSLPLSYTIPTPTLISVTPDTIDTNGGVNITVVGEHFLKISTLICNFGTTPAVTRLAVFINETTILCLTPSTSFPQQISLRVTNDGIHYSNILAMTYVLPVPSISALAPVSGSTMGGTRVTVTGKNFLQSRTLSCLFGNWGRVIGLVVAQTSLTQITCISPPATHTGPIDLSVSNDAITYSNNLTFTYQ